MMINETRFGGSKPRPSLLVERLNNEIALPIMKRKALDGQEIVRWSSDRSQSSDVKGGSKERASLIYGYSQPAQRK